MNHRFRVVVLISGHGSNLQALIDHQQPHYQLSAVISNHAEAYGLIRAKNAGIKTYTVDHQQYSSRSVFDNQLMHIIDSTDSDLIVLAGFMRILTPTFTRYYQGRLINIHPSLLPKFKGLSTHKKALLAGELTHGATVHFVTEHLDGGSSIIQACTPITPEDTIDSLKQRVQRLEHKIYPMAVNWFASGRLHYSHQEAWLDNQLLPPEGCQYTESEIE